MRISLRAWAVSAMVAMGAAAATHGAIHTFTGTFSPEGGLGASGSGTVTVTLDTDNHTLRVQAEFQGLSGTTTAAHIHAPTAEPFTGNASVATQTPSFAGFPIGVMSGSMDETFDTTQDSTWNAPYITANGGSALGAEAALLTHMSEVRAYFNIHTTTFDGGEIRAYLVPEPTSALVALLGMGLIACRRRARIG